MSGSSTIVDDPRTARTPGRGPARAACQGGRRRALRHGGLLLALVMALTGCTGSTDAGGPVADDTVQAGWGPPREFFGPDEIPTGPVLNAAVAGPYGEERHFTGVRAEDSTDGYERRLTLEGGGRYQAYVSFNNVGDEPATGVRVRVTAPATVDSRHRVTGYVEADNTSPDLLWSSTVVSTPRAGVAFRLRLVPDSVVVHVDGTDTSFAGSVHDLLGDGVLVGCSAPDGVVAPGCAGYVVYQFVADQADFAVTQRLRVEGADFTSAPVRVEPDGRLEVLVRYENTGTTRQNDVVLRAELPPGFSLVNGSGELTSPSSPDGRSTTDDIAGRGINVGNYAPGEVAELTFAVRAPAEPDCEHAHAEVLVRGVTDNGTKSDERIVRVDGLAGCS